MWKELQILWLFEFFVELHCFIFCDRLWVNHLEERLQASIMLISTLPYMRRDFWVWIFEPLVLRSFVVWEKLFEKWTQNLATNGSLCTLRRSTWNPFSHFLDLSLYSWWNQAHWEVGSRSALLLLRSFKARSIPFICPRLLDRGAQEILLY